MDQLVNVVLAIDSTITAVHRVLNCRPGLRHTEIDPIWRYVSHNIINIFLSVTYQVNILSDTDDVWIR